MSRQAFASVLDSRHREIDVRLFVEIGQVWLATTFANVLFYLFQVLVGRGLGPADYSLFAALFGIIYLTSALSIAIQASVAKGVAGAEGSYAARFRSRLVAVWLVRVAVLGAGMALVIGVASPWIASYLHTGSRTPVFVTGLVILMTLVLPIGQGALQGAQRFGFYAIMVLMYSGTRLILGLAVLALGLGINWLLIVSGLAAILPTVLALAAVKPSFKTPVDQPGGGHFLLVLIPALIGSVAITFPGSLDVVIVRHFFSAADAGLYSGTAVLGRTVLFLPAAISMVLFPKFAQRHARGESGVGLLYKGLWVTALLSGAVGVGYVLFPGLALNLLLGSSYAGAQSLVPLYAVGMVLFSLSMVFLYYHLAAGRTAYFYLILVPYLVLEVALMYLFHGSLTQVLVALLGANTMLALLSLGLTLNTERAPKRQETLRISPVTGSPLVSITVPAYNAAKTIRSTLESVLAQDYPNLEVVVVSDGSWDDTVPVVQEFPSSRVRLVEHPTNRGLAAAYTTGMAHTSGPIVMFLHSDCQLGSPSWVRQAVNHFGNPQVGWVTGHYETLQLEHTSLVDQAFAVLRSEMLMDASHQRNDAYPISFSEGKCDLIRRDVLAAVGGIPNILFRSGEDQLLSYAVRNRGWLIIKDGALRVQQNYPMGKAAASVKANLKKEFLHGKTQAVINLRFWSTIVGDVMHAPFAAPKRSHPVLKLGAFMITLASIASTLATMSPLALAPLAALVVVLVTYYLRKCRYTRVRPFSRLALLVVALGLCTFIPYGVGLVLGLFRYTLIKAGIYTKPI